MRQKTKKMTKEDQIECCFKRAIHLVWVDDNDNHVGKMTIRELREKLISEFGKEVVDAAVGKFSGSYPS